MAAHATASGGEFMPCDLIVPPFHSEQQARLGIQVLGRAAQGLCDHCTQTGP